VQENSQPSTSSTSASLNLHSIAGLFARTSAEVRRANDQRLCHVALTPLRYPFSPSNLISKKKNFLEI
jgi:hypothetical protein